MEYMDFLKNKIQKAPVSGFNVDPAELHPALKPHQRDAVAWALHGGRRALFEAFGLGKTVQELEDEYAGRGYGDFKKDLVEVTVSALSPIQERYNAIRNSDGLIDVLREGGERADAIAKKTLKRVQDRFGLGL